jgi:PBSX family phage terminase large subunit
MTMINVKEPGAKGAYTPYGGCLEAMTCKDHQMFLYGSAGSGKTTALCHKMMLLCMLYPGVKFLFTRKSYRSLVKSGVETFERVLREHGWEITNKQSSTKIHKMGDSEPREFRFPYAKRVGLKGDNPSHIYEGVSRVVLASLDKVYDEMGSEYDYVYVNQPEQIEEDDWQFLISRANGRRDVAPYPQLMGDPNPAHLKHWIKLGGYELIDGEKVGDGDRWRMIKSSYSDNPKIWDQRLDCFTPTGEEQIGRMMKSMNSIMQKRLIEGEWCSFDGLVYGEVWDRVRHIQSNKLYDIGDHWERYWAVDFGYTSPHAVLMFARNPENGQFVCYRQIIQAGITTKELARKIKDATIAEPRPRAIIADKNPESIAVLTQELGMNVIPAKKGAGSIKAGIDIVISMLKNDQLVFLEDSVFEEDVKLREDKLPIGFQEEVENYAWNPDKVETPIGENDHALDACRYFCTYIKASQRVVPFIWQ